MAKSKAPKKGKAPAKGKKGAKPTAPRKSVARQPAFAGMEQIRNGKLDRLCESIGDSRERKNKAVEDEASDSAAALSEMIRRDLHSYVHMGVRLTAKKGVDKLGIQLVKDKTEHGAQVGTAHDAVDTTTPEEGGEGAGDDSELID